MRRPVALALIGLALGVAAVSGFLSTRIDGGEVPVSVEEPRITTTTSPPSTIPTETTLPSLWDVNPVGVGPGDELGLTPQSLSIPDLGVVAPIDSYGVDVDGQMDVPSNVEDVGWYQFGPSPGEAGSAVLAAHVDLVNQGPGVFFDLKDIALGSLVTVGFDDGSARSFEVVARRVYDKDELPLEQIFSRTGPPVLTLITCGGGFSRSDRSYDSNVVVYAVPVASADPTPAQ